MSKTYKLMARKVATEEIGRFELAEGEDINVRVAAELDAAIAAGRLSNAATSVSLPPFSVQEIGEGENLSGGENVVSTEIYSPTGEPLSARSYRVDAVGEGHVAMAIEDDVDETPIGVFADETVAETIGIFWRNGHLKLPS